jgi:hypothetical protein
MIDHHHSKAPIPLKTFGVEIWVRLTCPECHRRSSFRGPRTNHSSVLVSCPCGKDYTIRDGITDLDIGVFFGDCRDALEPFPQEINPLTNLPVVDLPATLIDGPTGQGVLDATESVNKLN